MNTPLFFITLGRVPYILICLLTLAVAPLQAQRMSVPDATAAPVVVESASISTEVTGRIAVTTFDLVFRNPNGRVLEGTFEFPLLDGQSVVRFGVDINGRLREAVPVAKDRGRVVFEEIERRRVDPALLEQTAGNNYRARVYPIPANGTRRVVIAYQEDIAGRADVPTYRLALDFPALLKTFRLAVTIHTAETAAPKARTTLPLELPAWQNANLLEVEHTQFAARGVFELELPRTTHPELLTEKRGDNEYFYAEVPVAAAKPVTRPRPKVIGLLWDASGSGRERDHIREFALLDAWFTAVPDVEVRLIAFRDRTAAPIGFTIKHSDWSKLRSELEGIVYDGATSFDGLTDDAAVGEWLLFSDGLVNYGVSQTTTTLPLHAPVHTVLTSARSNPAFLRGLAQRQAGEFVNLLDTAPADGARLLRNDSLRVLRLDHNPEQVAQIYPEPNTPVREGTLIVTGILNAPSATIRLKLGHNASDAHEVTLSLHSGENPSRLAARAWAGAKIAKLSTEPAANREDIGRTSQEFGIVTADSSLIVLETLQDYVRYDIAPPEELRAAWEASRRITIETRQKERNTHLDGIVDSFNEKSEWWKTKFAKGEVPKVRDEKKPAEVTAAASHPTLAASAPSVASSIPALQEPAPVRQPAPAVAPLEDETIVLSPFVVEATEERGYTAQNTLAGTRIRMDMPDIASSVSVVTSQFLSDTAGTNSNQLLEYTKSSEVAGAAGNFGHKANEAAGSASISLQRWEEKAGYLDRLHRAEPGERYSIYLEERSAHARQPGFFLDVANFFFEAKDDVTAFRILSNLAELQLDDPALLRVLAHRLVQAGQTGLALPLFERVLVLRPEEPQSRRDLALVCATLKQNQRAIDLLWEIVAQPWADRFPDIELIALGELNAIIATCGEKLDLARIDPRLQLNLPVGLRVILTWDADNCDIDLWVSDPNGEQAIYSHPRTYQGGRMSDDFTGGYGPEEFLLRNPKPGKYTVKINYFGDRRQTALGPVTAQVRLITGFGTRAQKEQLLTVRLKETEDTLEIGAIEIGDKPTVTD